MNIKTRLSRIAAALCLMGILLPDTAVQAKAVVPQKDSVQAELKKSSEDLNGLQKLLKSYRAAGDSLSAGLALDQIGKYYNLNSNYILAIKYYQDAAKIQKNLNKSDYTNTLVSLATNCRRIGAYSSASDYLFEALRIIENSPEKDSPEGLKQRTYILNGIGNVYKYLNDGDQAEKYFRQSLAIDEKIGNELGQSMNWNTIGTIYEYRKQYDSAYVMYNRGLEHNNKSGSKNGAGICYNRLAQLAELQGKPDEAEKYYLKAFDVLTKSKDDWNLAKTTCNLGRIYIDKGEFAKGKSLLEESERLVAGNSSYGHLHDIHANLAELYERQGQYKKANDELKLCVAYRDSSFNQKSGQEVAQTRLRYEQEKSQQVIDQMVQENEHEKGVRNRIIYIALGVFLILLAILTFIYIYARLQRKRNQELAQMNAVKNKFFSIISHDLKNPVASQKQVLEMLVENFDSLDKSVVKQQCTELYNSSSSLLDLLTSLLNWCRLEAGKITNEPVRINIRDVAEESVRILEEQSKLKKIEIKNEIPEDAFAFADRNIVSTVIRNLVSNAIKYSYEGGSIEIASCSQDNEKVRVCITDHGTGIDEKMLEKLYSIEGQGSVKGTAGEKGTGLGLIVSREMIELTGGKMYVESQKGKGSRFCFTIPKSE